MLRYLGTGQRDYAAKPIRPGRRGWWEFQAVLSGRIAPMDEQGRQVDEMSGPRLWLFAPEYIHGWLGDGEWCTVAVFHFSWVPEGVERLLLAQGPVAMALNAEQVEQLAQWSIELAEHLRRPRASSPAHHLRVLSGLCCMLWQGVGDRNVQDPREADRQRVEDALHWYRQHLYQAPTVEDVAKVIYCSPAHLRRLFHQHRGCSPASALLRCRLQRAQELVEAGDLPLKTVASEAGFRSQEVFTRVFRQTYGQSPSRWRQRQRHRDASR